MGFIRRQPQSGQPSPSRDHYQEVANRIITASRRAWCHGAGRGTQASPGRTRCRATPPPDGATRGINVLMLAMSPFAWSTGDNRWCSYKQAQARGWQVRRGEHGTVVFFFKKLAVKDEAGGFEGAGEGEERFIPMLRAHTVFHASQIEGVPALVPVTPVEATWRRTEAVDVILRNSGAVIRVGGAQAFYCPGTDHIQLPPHETFSGPETWAATALHELAHWSGASSRLDRDLSGKFGTPRYAEEELRAEISSAFMGAELGLPADIPNHASYLRNWLRKLREDKREIFRAAAAAQRVADFCLAFHPDYRGDADARGAMTNEDEMEVKQAA